MAREACSTKEVSNGHTYGAFGRFWPKKMLQGRVLARGLFCYLGLENAQIGHPMSQSNFEEAVAFRVKLKCQKFSISLLGDGFVYDCLVVLNNARWV